LGGCIVKVNHTFGAAVFIGHSNVTVPFAFELFAARAHALPEMVIFIQVTRSFESSDKKQLKKGEKRENFKVNLATKNLMQIDIWFGFNEREAPLLEILNDAFTSVDRDMPVDLTVYHCQFRVRVKKTAPFYYKPPLHIYKLLKDLFPDEVPIEVPSDILTILVHTQDLDGDE
jgi:hypothetical protein